MVSTPSLGLLSLERSHLPPLLSVGRSRAFEAHLSGSFGASGPAQLSPSNSERDRSSTTIYITRPTSIAVGAA